MNCVRCGDGPEKHCRADGACMKCGCPKMLTTWLDTEGEEQELKKAPALAVKIPLDKLKAPDES